MEKRLGFEKPRRDEGLIIIYNKPGRKAREIWGIWGWGELEEVVGQLAAAVKTKLCGSGTTPK